MTPYLEEYLDFSDPAEIKVRDHRVWLHHVLKEYLHRELTLAELCERFDTLNKEQILACLLYYHRFKDETDRYLGELGERFRARRAKYYAENADLRARLLKRQQELATAKKNSA